MENILNTYNFKNNKYLTKIEERNILIKAKQGDELSQNQLIQNNLKLITKIAKKYINYGIPLNDLIQEGIIGLINAIKKFDLNYKCKFITYAYYKIRQAIANAIANNSRTIRVPIYMHDLHIKYKQIYEKEFESKGITPTDKELSETLDVPIHYINYLKEFDRTTISINSPISDESDKELIDTLISEDINIEDIIINNSLIEEVNKLLNTYDLDKKDIEIIKYRFGFYNNRIYTYKEIASILNISVESTRKYYERAIIRLRELEYTKNLVDYAYDRENAINMLKQ